MSKTHPSYPPVPEHEKTRSNNKTQSNPKAQTVYYWDASSPSNDAWDPTKHSLEFPQTKPDLHPSMLNHQSDAHWPQVTESVFDWPQHTESSEAWDGVQGSGDLWNSVHAASQEPHLTVTEDPLVSRANHPLYPHLASVFEAYQAYRSTTLPQITPHSPSSSEDLDEPALQTVDTHQAAIQPTPEALKEQTPRALSQVVDPLPNIVEAPSISGKKIIDDRYEIIQLLGEGNYGQVYKVRDIELDDVIALKMLLPDACRDEEQIARFRREALLSRRITHHNIARVYDIGKDKNAYYMTMEFIDGATLASWMKKKTSFSLQEVLEIMLQLCDGLAAAHRLGIIHRDLKPENIMVGNDGRIVITDFGIARQDGDKRVFKTSSGDVFATPAYMSPEQIKRNIQLDHKTDIYTLGIILYELLCKVSPTPGDNVQAILVKRLTLEPPNPCVLRSDVSQSLGLLTQQCMALQPEERPADILALRDALFVEKENLFQKKKKSYFSFFSSKKNK